MISTKEDLKNVIELEKKGYGRNSLIRRYLRELRICEYYKNRGGGYENLYILKHLDWLESFQLPPLWKFRYFKASTCHSCNDKTYRSKLL